MDDPRDQANPFASKLSTQSLRGQQRAAHSKPPREGQTGSRVPPYKEGLALDEEDALEDLMSESEEHEMGEIQSHVGSDVDEETGLTGEEHGRKRSEDELDVRIAGANGHITKEARRLADRNVLRRLLVNSVLIGLWYIFSLSISIYNKWMFSPENLDFHFPLFTTALHMFVQFSLSAIVLLVVPSLRPKLPSPVDDDPPPKPLLTLSFYITRLVPTGFATSLDIGLGNTSLRYITLTFYTMCKSSVLIFVLLFAFLFGLESPSLKLILIITTMTIGVLMMVFGETAFNALGFALALSASFFSGFRWALTQILLLRHPVTSNPFSTLFLLAPIMFATLFVLALASEGVTSVLAAVAILINDNSPTYVCALLLFPGCLAFCMVAAEFTLLQRTNIITLSICGIFKEVLTIAAAEITFHDKLTLINILGLVITICCIACYNYLKVNKMRKDARAEVVKHIEVDIPERNARPEEGWETASLRSSSDLSDVSATQRRVGSAGTPLHRTEREGDGLH